jgi:hypothetical protein
MNWKASSSTDHYLRAISKVWLDRGGWEHGRQNRTLRILVGSPILFFQVWHFGPGMRVKNRRECLFALCTVPRVLSVHCSVRSHLGRFRIVEDLMCACRWLWDSGPLNLALWKIPVGKTSSHWCACRADWEYWDPLSWFVCCALKKWCAVKVGIQLWRFGPSPVFEGLKMYSIGP